ncbi:MAG: hypothetical protein JRJ84_26050 [Deltaproteobacteria bacterium]|nr:hypothetical protein [Deltaproteobacteria bacterium]
MWMVALYRSARSSLPEAWNIPTTWKYTPRTRSDCPMGSVASTNSSS